MERSTLITPIASVKISDPLDEYHTHSRVYNGGMISLLEKWLAILDADIWPSMKSIYILLAMELEKNLVRDTNRGVLHFILF